MNDPRSMAIGWTALIVAAGTGYYFARKDLNERRREQAKQGLRGPAKDWREKIAETSESQGTSGSASSGAGDVTSSAPVPSSTNTQSSSTGAKKPS